MIEAFLFYFSVGALVVLGAILVGVFLGLVYRVASIVAGD